METPAQTAGRAAATRPGGGGGSSTVPLARRPAVLVTGLWADGRAGRQTDRPSRQTNRPGSSDAGDSVGAEIEAKIGLRSDGDGTEMGRDGAGKCSRSGDSDSSHLNRPEPTER